LIAFLRGEVETCAGGVSTAYSVFGTLSGFLHF